MILQQPTNSFVINSSTSTKKTTILSTPSIRRRMLSSLSLSSSSSSSSSIEIVKVGSQRNAAGDHQKEIRIQHQYFLGDLESIDGKDLTGLKLWPTSTQPMINHIHKNILPTIRKQRRKKSDNDTNKNNKIRILELGSGCGLLGIGIASLNDDVEVILTDAAVDFVDSKSGIGSNTIEWIQRNINLNRNLINDRVIVKKLLWGNKEDMNGIILLNNQKDEDKDKEESSSFDLVIGSELLYNNDATFPDLVQTMIQFTTSPDNGDNEINNNENNTSSSTAVLLGYKVRHLGESKFFQNEILSKYYDVQIQNIGRKSDNMKLATCHRR